MRILAIETVTSAGSVALADGAQLVVERVLPPKLRSAQSLIPAIADVLTQVGWSPRQIELVGVVVGPGSFTGLRVGVVTAKTLGYALRAGCVGVTSLETIVAQAPLEAHRLAVAIDAGRNQVYAARYARNAAGVWEVVTETTIVDNEAWLAALDPSWVASGPALERLAPRLPPGAPQLTADLWSPRAATVARLAWQRAQSGQIDDVWRLAPQYIRRSAAEEKLDAQGATRQR